MSEIKTPPVAAQHIPDKEEFGEKLIPGSFRITSPDSEDAFFWYVCPCGCTRAVLSIGKNFKPEQGPSWQWNGSFDKPTLSPSVHHVGHWHGWLRDGVWVSC